MRRQTLASQDSISRYAGLPGHSFEWRGLSLLTWNPAWNFWDSRGNVFDNEHDYWGATQVATTCCTYEYEGIAMQVARLSHIAHMNGSCDACESCEWAMWVSHVSESCDMYAGVMSRIRECVYSGMSHDSSSCLSHVPSSCLSHEWVYSGMSQPKMSHVTRMDESCDTHEDDTHEEEDLGACHFQKQVVWQRWTSYVTRMNASRHTFE